MAHNRSQRVRACGPAPGTGGLGGVLHLVCSCRRDQDRAKRDAAKTKRTAIRAHANASSNPSASRIWNDFVDGVSATIRAPLVRLEPKMLQRILGLALLAILVLLAYVLYLHHRLRNRLRIVFGIKWDRNATAYCPGCDKPLTEYKEGPPHTGPHFSCLTCHSALGIHDDTGKALTLLEAKRRLRSN